MRAPASTVELIDLVRKSGILPGSNLDEKLSIFPSLPVDPSASAALLVKQGMLTKFQAKLLLTGRWRGFKLGSYVVREQIGQGGMGAVYLAEHETLKRQVALKVLPPAKGDQNAKLSVERFLREARAVAALDHPNIVRIHDVGHQGDVHFLVMEYVEGQTLEDMLRKGGPVTPSRAVEYIAQAAAGLQHALEKGFVHRDIKPANLILAKDGTIKILDMGLARSSSNESDKLTERMDEGAIVGTADFISPEQAMNAPNIDIRSDIYSLGATFYALVTGTPPFAGNTTQKLVQHQMKDAPSLTTLDRTFPPALAKVVAKMLQKKPEKRYQSPGDVISAVAEWLPNAGAQRLVASLSGTDLAHSAEMQATLSEIATGGTQRIGPTKRLGAVPAGMPWKLYAGVGGAVVAAAILVGWMVFGGSSEDRLPAASTPSHGPLAAAPSGTAPISNPNLTPKSTPTQPIKASLPPPSSGRVVQRFDPAQFETFRAVFRGNSLREGRVGKLPPGWNLQVYNAESVGEFRVEAFDGHKELVLGSLEGKASTQIVFRADRANLKLYEPGKTYEVRFDCRADAGVKGHSAVQTIGDWKSLVSTDIVEMNWKWLSHRFVMPPTGDVQMTFGPDTTAPDKFIHIRKVEIVEVGASTTATAGAVRFALDLGQQQPFVEGGKLVMGSNMQKEWKVQQKTGPGNWPANWSGRPWRELDEADFFAEPSGDRTVLGSRNTQGKGSSMLISPEVDGFDGRCVVEVEYRTDAKLPVKPGLRFLPTKPTKDRAFDLVKLDVTNGVWKTVLLEVDLKGSTAGRFEFHNNDTGPGGEFRLRRLVASTAAVGGTAERQLFHLDPATIPAFRAMKQGSTIVEGANVAFPKGVYLHGHKPETLSEVRRETVDGVAAFALTHRSDVESAQLGLEFDNQNGAMALPLQVGGTYVLRFTYKTAGSASGVSYFQEFGTWNQLKTIELPSSAAWKTVEYEATKTDQPLRAVIDLRGTGEGNTLYIREVTLLEPGTKPAPMAAPAAKPVVEGEIAKSVSFGAVAPFRCTFADSKTDFDLGAVLPAGTWLNCWNAASVAEFRANEVEGRTGLGITNLNDTVSAQLLVNDVNKLVPGQNYRVKIDYLTKNDSTGKVYLRKPKDNFASFASADLPGTNGQWKTATLDFVRPAAGVDIDFLLGNASVGEGNTVYVNKIEFVTLIETESPGRTSRAPSVEPAPEGTKVFAVDFVGKVPFQYTIQDKKPSLETWKVLPAGVKGLCWKNESSAEFRGADVNGKPAFGMTNLNDAVSSQMQVDFGEGPASKIAGGKSYRARIEYLTSNDAAGTVSLRKPKEKFVRIVQTELPGTGGEWKAATLEFTAPAGVPLDLVIENTTSGAGNTLHVAKVEIFEVN